MPNLMTSLKLAASVILLSLTSACFEERILVNVDKHGSGTIEHRSYNNLDDLMSSMLGGLGGVDSQSSAQAEESEYNDAFFAAKAREMGEGVSVQSWKLAKNNAGFEGYEAIYRYQDINKLSVATAPGNKQQTNDSAPIDSSALEANHHFTMQNGKLIIHTPEPETEENQEQISNQLNEAATQQMLAMMGAMFRGARVSVDVKALDTIAASNARHRDGNLVTIMDVRIDELMADPKLFTELQQFNSLSREQAQALADQINGIDVDTQAEIVIQF